MYSHSYYYVFKDTSTTYLRFEIHFGRHDQRNLSPNGAESGPGSTTLEPFR